VALITGSSSGIGEATATTLAALGYRVFASGRTLENVEHLRGRSPSVEIMEMDVADEDSVRRGVQRVLDAAGRIDVVVNNAGFAIFGAVEDLDREALRRQFEVNVFGAMSVCRAVLPGMRRRGSGCIVNVSSLAGRIAPPLLGAYCASKFALEALSDSLRVEARPFGIHVVVLEPGAIITRFQDRAMKESAKVLANTDSIMRASTAGPLQTTRRLPQVCRPGMSPNGSRTLLGPAIRRPGIASVGTTLSRSRSLGSSRRGRSISASPGGSVFRNFGRGGDGILRRETGRGILK